MLNRYLLASLTALLLLAAPHLAQAQTGSVGIGTTTPDASAALDVSSTTQGLLAPRLSAAQRLAIASPAQGLTVYQTDAPTTGPGAGTAAGFWYNAGPAAAPQWQRLADGVSYSASTGLQVGTAAPAAINVATNSVIYNNTGPLLGSSPSRKQAYLLPPAMLTAAGINPNLLLTKLALNVVTKHSTGPFNNFTIRLANTAITSTGGAAEISEPLTTVYSGAVATAVGLNTFSFSQAFKWDGTSSLYVVFCFDNPAAVGDDYIYFGPDVNTIVARYVQGTGVCASNYTTVDHNVPAIVFTQGGAYTLPAGAGTVGQVLTQQASGTVGFQTPQWAQSGTNLYPSNLASNVGVGTASPTQKLDMRGNVRLGDDGGSVAGPGQAVEFIGPGFNTDPVGIYRVNTAADQSELRVVVGDAADANDKFAVGRMPGTTAEGGIPTGNFTPTFSVSSTGQVQAPGLAGTSTRMVTADATGILATAALPIDAQQLSISGSTLALTNGGSVTLPGDNLGNHTATQNLNLGTNSLVGNGGTTGLTISSAGSAIVAGAVQVPAANAYRYAAPKAYSVTYGYSDMQSEEESPNAYRKRVTFGGAEYVYATTAQRIPLHLPQGATITGIKFYCIDTDATYNVVAYFISVLPTDTSLSGPAYSDVGNSVGTPGYTTFTITPASPVIDNNRAYYVLISATATTYAIGAVRVSYTVTQTE